MKTDLIADLIEMPAEHLNQLDNQEYADLFVRGRRFRVVKACELTGWIPEGIGGGRRTWGHRVGVDTILTCNGFSNRHDAHDEEFLPVCKWLDKNAGPIANDCTISALQAKYRWNMIPVQGLMLPLYAAEESMPRPQSKKRFYRATVTTTIISETPIDVEILESLVNASLRGSAGVWNKSTACAAVEVLSAKDATELAGVALPGVDAEGRELV